MTTAQQIVFLAICVLIVLFATTTVVRFVFLNRMIRKLIGKVDNFDTIIRLLDYRIAAMGDRMDRMENRGKDE